MGKRVLISKMEHYSKVFASVSELKQDIDHPDFFKYTNDVELTVPDDVEEYLGKRGLKSKDNLTKCVSYLAKKILINEEESMFDSYGIIFATEYGNLNSMLHLSKTAFESEEPVSAQVFPNATISSATVSASIYTKIRGVNLTINQGILSFLQALNIAVNYIKCGKLKKCLVLVGDEYNLFSKHDMKYFYHHSPIQFSMINGVLLSDGNLPHAGGIVIDNIDLGFGLELEDNAAEQIIGGYITDRKYPEDKDGFHALLNPPLYLGASITFLQLVQGIKRMDENERIKKYQLITYDSMGNVGEFYLKKDE